MNKTKRLGDRELPGSPLYWIFGSIIGVFGLLVLTGAILANTPDSGDGYARPTEQKMAITPNKQQEAVRSMADFMVKDDNMIGLRMWARSLGISSPEFSSAATLREEIKRASNDFEIYRDKSELFKLFELLGNDGTTFGEITR